MQCTVCSLRNAITEAYQQLPRLLALFAAESVFVQLRADSPMYSPLNKLLLKQPALPLDTLPLFLTALNSSDATYCRQRRLWVLRLLFGALIVPLGYDDVRIIRRQFIPDLLTSLSASTLADANTRAIILSGAINAAVCTAGSTYVSHIVLRSCLANVL